MTSAFTPSAALPTRSGDFRVQAFTDEKGLEHPVLIKGEPQNDCLVRLHSECATGDVLGSLRCDCRAQLEMAMEKINDAGSGLLIYLRGHEGRGIGLANKIKAYALQDEGCDTVEANIRLGFKSDQRDYTAALAVLKHYNLTRVRLLTNNPRKVEALEAGGVQVTAHVPLWTASNPSNAGYLDVKRTRMGHI